MDSLRDVAEIQKVHDIFSQLCEHRRDTREDADGNLDIRYLKMEATLETLCWVLKHPTSRMEPFLSAAYKEMTGTSFKRAGR